MSLLLPLELGIASHTCSGRSDSGDRHALCPFLGGVLLGVVDGLGHGPEASEASRLAAATLEEHASEPIPALIARCHERLRPTRGVTMSLASIRHDNLTLAWAGVGNVEGILVRGTESAPRPREFLLPKAGVVGVQVPSLNPEVLPLAPGDTIVFATDGIRGNFLDAVTRITPAQIIANHILRHHHRDDDDALVLVARYRGDGR